MAPTSTMCLALMVTSMLTLCQGQTQSQGKDATLVMGQGGPIVVNAVIAQIRSKCIFSEDRLFLRRVAYAMSEDGTAAHTYRAGFDGGIWQITAAMFQATRDCGHIYLQKACANISVEMGIDWSTVTYSDLRKPLYSGLAAALSAHLALAGAAMPGSVAEQGQVWLTMYGGNSDSSFTSKANIPAPACNDKMDLTFILDASGSVSHPDFQLMLRFTSDLVGALNLSRDAVRVANIVFSGNVIVGFAFNGYSSKTDAQSKVMSSYKENRGTNTHLALNRAQSVLYDTGLGARTDAKKVAVLITDGRSNDEAATKVAAAAFKKPGTNVFAVGVGNYSLPELILIASKPTCSHMLTLTQFDQIEAIHTEILKSSCEANKKFTVDNPATGTIGPNGTNSTTETDVPGNNQTIQASVSCGILDVYVSTTNPKPSAAVHSNYYRGTPNQPARLTLTETLPSGTLVYVTIVGTRLPEVAAHTRNCTDYNWTMAVVPDTSVPVADVVTVAIEGGGRKGRLLATINGQTGTVCDDAATDDLAAVVCQELGFNVTRAAVIPVVSGSSLPIVMDDAYCTGSESKLGDCAYVTVSNCDHTEDIGIDCPSDDPCETSPCQNGGQCNKVDPVTFTCQCTADYTGTTCQTYVDPCDPNPCQSGGQCTRVDATTFTCRCTADYTGDTCQTFLDPCDPNPCQNGGLCTRVDASTFTCQCTVDYTGDTCQTYLDPCDPNPCQNGGQCTRVDASTFTCQCNADYNGDTCQTFLDPCDPNPCQNGGQCTRMDATTFTCQCSPGYLGDTCQTVDVHCNPNPCQNGGQCANNGTTFSCQCSADYEGSVCENYIDPCDSSPCQTGGTCVRDSASTYHCDCPPGTAGIRCELFETCSLSYYNMLTTFAEESVIISIPCTYDLLSMQCGDFNIKVQGTTRGKCQTNKCYKKGEANVIAEAAVSVSSSQLTWEATVDFSILSLSPKVSGDSSLVVVSNEKSKAWLATSDDVLYIAFSKEEGIKLLCSDMRSSAEYPTSLCGAGSNGNVTIADRTKELDFKGDYQTLAFDILMNDNVQQTKHCSLTAGTMLNVCDNPIESFDKCRRCSKSKLNRVKLNCLKQCLPRKGDCKP